MSAMLQKATVKEAGGYEFRYTPDTVTVSRDRDSAAATLQWAFGAGSVGFTAVGRFEGRYFEHRVSYFTADARSGITPGQPSAQSSSAVQALGVFKSPHEAHDCFDCHATNVLRDAAGGPDLSVFTPGIDCERCHGPAGGHVIAARTGKSSAEIRAGVFNPANLPAKALVEMCGGCHRNPEPGSISRTPELDNPASVRFQPVGLMASECFRKSGARLTCLTCHNAHRDAIRNNPGYYGAKCRECHSTAARAASLCKRNEAQDCLPCHMPQSRLMPFTDHRIRIYRASGGAP